MARPRKFDEERAVDEAMRIFWRKGYEATSTQDLCEATGLGRSSIYNTFRSKHDLFEQALTRYVELMTGAQLAILDDERHSPGERIRALFDKVIDDEEAGRHNGRGIGCLTVNTTVELADRDPRTRLLLRRDLERRLAALSATIALGQRTGDIASARDPGALAQFVTATIAGIRVSAQGGADRAALNAIALSALDALGC